MVIVLVSWEAAGAFGSRGAGPGELGSLVLALLAERRQEHDPSVLGEAIGDAAGRLPEREAHLEEPVSQALRERHAGHRTDRRETIDRDDSAVPIVFVEGVHPVDHLVVELDLGHSPLSHACDHRTRAIIVAGSAKRDPQPLSFDFQMRSATTSAARSSDSGIQWL